MKIKKRRSLKVLRFKHLIAMSKGCRCPLCFEKVDKEEFRSEMFKKQFETTGLCQGCLDMIFGYNVAW